MTVIPILRKGLEEETKLFNLLQGYVIQKITITFNCNIFQMLNIPGHANNDYDITKVTYISVLK